ncbi:hypothetical protein HAX54_003104 [Datura stramonium]|uniref:Uncharacterized protein n=1 Tax=Datura stramonium TaxID=4076 RepID=A0ABS8RTA1_DATST|nr:hypothetical protein [Datura stramonium]
MEVADGGQHGTEEVSFIDLQKNLKTLSQKELRALANVLIDAYYAGKLVKLNALPGEGPGEKVKSSDSLDSGADLKSTEQEIGSPSRGPKNLYARMVGTSGSNATNKQPIYQGECPRKPYVGLGLLSSTLHLPHLSSSTPRSTKKISPSVMVHESSSTISSFLSLDHRKCPSTQNLGGSSEFTSSPPLSHEEGWLDVLINLNEVPPSTGPDSNGVFRFGNGDKVEPGRSLVRWELSELKEGTSNILQHEEAIIEGFITALATRTGGFGKRTPTVDHAEFDTIEVPEPSAHESEVNPSQEEPLVSDPLKWDGTPTLFESLVDASPPPFVLLPPLLSLLM